MEGEKIIMKVHMMKKRSIFLIYLSLIIFLLLQFATVGLATEADQTQMVKGKIVEILDENELSNYNQMGENIKVINQLVKVKILTGKYKGETVICENNNSGNLAYDIILKRGERVVLELDVEEGIIIDAYVADHERDRFIYVLGIILILLILLIGRKQGLKAILSLGLSIFIIAKIMLPYLLQGYNPLLLSIGTAAIVSFLTFLIIGGITRKSLAAMIGTVGGVAVAGLIALIIGKLAHLTGLSDHEAQMLIYIPQGIQFDFRGILLAGIIIGALGAVMDVGISIASAMEEIKKQSGDISTVQLVKAGMNVGRDIMGTMSNTLVLAYTGSSIPLILLFMAYETPFYKVVNLDLIATEIIRALVGSIGLVLAIPITAFVSGWLLGLSEYKKVSR